MLLRIGYKEVGVEWKFTFVSLWLMLSWNFTSEFLLVGLLPMVVPPMK